MSNQKAVNAEVLGLVGKSGPSRTTNLFLVGIGVLAIGGAIGFIVYILNTQDCETNGDCESGVCDKNTCVECVKSSDCNSGFECKENACKAKPTAPPQCTQDSDCTQEQPSCTDGKCFCTEASCKAKGDNFVCDSKGGCIDTTVECTGNGDCGVFDECSENKCVKNNLTIGLTIGGVVVLVALLITVEEIWRRRKRGNSSTKTKPDYEPLEPLTGENEDNEDETDLTEADPYFSDLRRNRSSSLEGGIGGSARFSFKVPLLVLVFIALCSIALGFASVAGGLILFFVLITIWAGAIVSYYETDERTNAFKLAAKGGDGGDSKRGKETKKKTWLEAYKKRRKPAKSTSID